MTYRELFYKAVRLINKGEITLGEYKEMTKPLDREVEQEPRWIPISEVLPKRFKTVIVSTDGDEVFIADYLGKMDDGTDCFEDNDGMVCEGKVVAWMPLPSAYMRGGRMTREKAKIKIEQLDYYLSHTCQDYGERDHEAMMMAVKGLEQEPFINKPCVSSGVCEHDKNVVLDKLRAEIVQLPTSRCTETCIININADDFKENVLEIFDKYKAES